jgi:hypothetical protein
VPLSLRPASSPGDSPTTCKPPPWLLTLLPRLPEPAPEPAREPGVSKPVPGVPPAAGDSKSSVNPPGVAKPLVAPVVVYPLVKPDAGAEAKGDATAAAAAAPAAAAAAAAAAPAAPGAPPPPLK